MTIALSLILAAVFLATGLMKAFNTETAQKNATHLGLATRQSRLIGVVELAASVALVAGLAWPPLTIATAAGTTLLMFGAIGSHLRVRDSITAMLPALVVLIGALALLAISVLR